MAKPVKLSVIPGTLYWHKKTDFYRLPCDLHTCTVAHRYSPHPHNNINVILKHFKEENHWRKVVMGKITYIKLTGDY